MEVGAAAAGRCCAKERKEASLRPANPWNNVIPKSHPSQELGRAVHTRGGPRVAQNSIKTWECSAPRCPSLHIWLREQMHQRRQNTGFGPDLSHGRNSFVSVSPPGWLRVSLEEYLVYLFPIFSSPLSVFIDLLA